MKLNKVLEYAPEHLKEYDYICGIDEVGRGCGAGPVVTAAVILPKNFSSPLLRDSKKLTETQRKEAYNLIIENAIAYSCHASTMNDINDLGINPATFKTMRRNIEELGMAPQYILLDGIVWDNVGEYKIELIPKGDDTYLSIAAAAIVAKVKRDEYMTKLDELHPNYGWKSNKGYLTSEHIEAIKTFGVCKYHRNQYVRNFI